MKKNFRTALYFTAGLAVGAGAIATLAFRETTGNEGNVEVKQDGRLQYKWYAPEMPKSMSFAGEAVPLDQWEVKERLDKDILVNYYMHGSTLYILKLTSRYFPLIEERLKANGVPDDFKYVCIAESSLQQLTSSAGAVGLWQFMKTTAPQYGLEVNDEVDERYHIRKATDAACVYFKQAYAKFGNWTAAAASYNCGMGGYNSQATFQGTNDYYNLLLPEETNRYIFRILALKYMVTNQQGLGYMIMGQDAYKPIKTRTVQVSSTVPNLAQFASENGTNYKMLKLLNPWLRDRRLTVKPGKTYEIEIPLAKQ